MSDRERAPTPSTTALLERQGERWVQPRVERTRRVLELLDDPQRTYRVVHVTGTNGKTSTSRIIESLVRAHGLRTGLFTSPHLERFTERIMIDGEPIADAAVADAWDEIAPFVDLVDAELAAADDAPLTFFELLTVLAFVAFADAPIDVLVLEVGMGGSWDSTNTADGDVAVFAPIDIDHADRLGDTIARDRRGEGGHHQGRRRRRLGAAGCRRRGGAARGRRGEGRHDRVRGRASSRSPTQRLAVGGQLISVRGLAGVYDDEYLPLFGGHQALNAALAIAAVESLIGGGIAADRRRHPGRRARAGDFAGSPPAGRGRPDRDRGCRAQPARRAGARRRRCGESFDFDEWGVVLGVLADKDAAGIVAELAPLAAHVFATAPDSERAERRRPHRGSRRGAGPAGHGACRTSRMPRRPRARGPRHPIVAPSSIAGSVVLAGEAVGLAAAEDWKAGWTE